MTDVTKLQEKNQWHNKIKMGKWYDGPKSRNRGNGCHEIGLVAFMCFFELLFSYVSLTISFYVSFTNLFSFILFLIC